MHKVYVFQMKDERWCVRMVTGSGTARSVQNKTFRTEDEARRYGYDKEQEVETTGIFRKVSKLTFAEYVAEWLEDYDDARATRRTYDHILRNHVLPLIGHCRLQELHVDQIDRMLKTIRKKTSAATGRPLEPRTFNLICTALTTAFNMAVAKEYLVRSPLRKGNRRPLGERKEKQGPLSPENLTLFWEALHRQSIDDLEFAQVAVSTGLRLSEVCGLNWSNVDFANSEITVTHQRRQHDAITIERTPTKNRKVRTIPIETAMVAVLAERAERMRAAGGGTGKNAPVFAGGMEAAARVGNRMNKLMARLGLPGGIHRLRHTYATHLLDAGHNPETVAKLTGHNSVAFLLTHYYRPDRSVLRATATTAASLITPPASAKVIPLPKKG
jgi:integrase